MNICKSQKYLGKLLTSTLLPRHGLASLARHRGTLLPRHGLAILLRHIVAMLPGHRYKNIWYLTKNISV